MIERKQQPLEQTLGLSEEQTEQTVRRLIRFIQNQKKYQDGYDHAKKCFEHSFETGHINLGSSESTVYCEVVAFAIKDRMKMTPKKINALDGMKKFHKGCSDAYFYGGVYDLLVEKIKEHQTS